MAKNIIVFCDGTGQEGGKKFNTNIYHMFNMILDRTPQQIACYIPGVGTGSKKITGNIGGNGISTNIKLCYKFIFDHYESGDQIFLIGFSRGAATVRSLSSFIHYFGILPQARPKLIDQAYRIYKIKDIEERKRKADEFIALNRTMWTKIKFLGCYDTVAALGLPIQSASVFLDGFPLFRHRFHNFKLSESVEHAYQALAIDDERKTFHPILWDTEIEPGQTIRQVWFCGMHTDVGGGYSVKNLSDIPMAWMLQQAIKHGLILYPQHNIRIEEDANGYMHNSRGSGITRIYRKMVRSWDANRTDKPVIHQSVLDRIKNQLNTDNPQYHPWIFDLDYEVEPWIRYDQLQIVQTETDKVMTG